MKAPPEGEVYGFELFVNALIACEKPVLTAINGLALGIGVTMLLHTDINYIARGARLKCPFVPLGVVPEAGSSLLLPAIMGAQRAAEFLFTSPWLSSTQAVEFGLAVEEIAPDRLLQAVIDKAEVIATQPPESVQATKRLMKADATQAIDQARKRENAVFVERLGSPENKEAIAAFFEKRAPDFSKF